ncbi:MAG TPA: hypothetical protein VEM96_00960 [Pyrinomonadaceae bacterium]|nr:hypothetical protein [Pyrinomonadaceae bacterium]
MAESAEARTLLELHVRLLDGDRVASEDLAELLLMPLVRRLNRKFSRTDVQVVSDGVTDAILDYCARPQIFDPSRGVPLNTFLLMAGRRNILNLIRGEMRRKAREERFTRVSSSKVVELYPSTGNTLRKEAIKARRRTELMQVLSDPVDKKVFELELKGERKTEAFAKVMGISGLPVADQRRAVKRAKDRIRKLLERRKGDA